MSDCDRGQDDVEIVANFGECSLRHVTALRCPFVVLFEQQGAHEAVDGGFVREDAYDVSAALDLVVGAL